MITNDTEQGLTLAPGSHWQWLLKPKLERLVAQKFSGTQRVRPDDTTITDETTITVAMNDRSEHNLTKRFEKSDIDWSSVENQLLCWGGLFRAGKKLRLIVVFHYIEDSRSYPRKGDKRGPHLRLKRMQGEIHNQLDGERASGQSSVWRQVYELMRCRDK